MLTHPAFVSGNFDTHFIQNYFNPEEIVAEKLSDEEFSALATAAVAFFSQSKSNDSANVVVNSSLSESEWYSARKNY